MKRLLLAAAWILGASILSFAQSTVYFPHIVNGPLGGHTYKTTIFLTNPAANGSGALTGRVIFLREEKPISRDGTTLSITMIDGSGQTFTGSTIDFALTGGQSLKLTSTGTGAFTSGFAVVLSTAPVSGTAAFSDFDGAGKLLAEAGVPAVSAVPRQTIFIDTVGGYNVGVAFANPDIVAAPVTLTLLNTAGVTVASTAQTLGAGNHNAAFTDQLFSNVSIPPMAGTMQLTSSVPLAAIALRYDPSLSVFTTLPPVTIASLLSPAFDWMAGRPWLTPLSSIARLLGSLTAGLG